jgi:hypothetical protein
MKTYIQIIIATAVLLTSSVEAKDISELNNKEIVERLKKQPDETIGGCNYMYNRVIADALHQPSIDYKFIESTTQALNNNEKIQEAKRNYGILNTNQISYGYKKLQASLPHESTKRQVVIFNSCLTMDTLLARLVDQLHR